MAEIDYQIAGGRYAMFECYSYHPAGAVTQKTLNSHTNNTPEPMTATYSYDGEGRVLTLACPWSGTGGTSLTYTYDALGRPYTVTGGATTVSSATYGPSNEMLTLSTNAFNETRTYNSNLQLTNVTSGGYNFTYNYSATQNNGKIQSMTDAISGETITYHYDTLNRLASASGTGDANGAWSQTFTYDGFGNLVAKAGNNAPNNVMINVNPANNQLTNSNGNNPAYDAVGNLLSYGALTAEQLYSYDIENRVTQVTANSVVTKYGYDTRNQRIYSGPQTTGCGSTEKYFFYGVDGKKLAVVTARWTTSGTCSANYPMTVTQTNVWFAGRLLVPQDRLHSHGKYFPYGEDRTNPNPANPANGVEKFATYTRDAESGLDYAYQRYYTSGLGRLLTADRKGGSGSPGTPQSWNRYAYAQGDPANATDPTGMDIYCYVDEGGNFICIDDPPPPNDPQPDPTPGNPSGCPAGSVYYNGLCINAGNDGLGGVVGQPPVIPPPTPSNLLKMSVQDITADLKKPKCANDFKNIANDLTKLGNVGFKSYGAPAFTTTPSGQVVPQPPGSIWQRLTNPCGDGIGCYNPVTGSINLNSNINWLDPANTAGTLNGSPYTYNALTAEGALLGVSAVTPGQFMDIVILHELEHYNGTLGNPDNPSVEQRLWKDCIM